MEHNFNANTAFLINWPHGILKAVHWFSSLITLLFVHNRAYLIWFSENIQYDFPGYQLVLFTAYTFFIYSFVSWMAHFTGVLKVKSGDNQQEGNVWKLAEIDMWICTGFTVLYLTSIVICLMAVSAGGLEISYLTHPRTFVHFDSTAFLLAGISCSIAAISTSLHSHFLHSTVTDEYRPII